MLNFVPFSVEALKKALPYIKKNPSLCCDVSAGYVFMWHVNADVHFCEWNDTFVIRQRFGEQPAFSYPIGADPDGMIDELKNYAFRNHLPLRFYAVDEETLEKILEDKRLQPATWAYDRRWSDYIYSFKEAATFKGKKFSGQRNHINKFKKTYGEPDVRFLTADDRRGVSEMLEEYALEHRNANALEKLELERTKKLIDVYETLGLYGAGLFVEGKVVAFSIGEIVGDKLLIHVEKALTRFDGVYPTMYSGFVRLISGVSESPLKFVNREDDSGDEGLRTSKMQYHPIAMADKRLVHIDSPAVKLDPKILFSSGDLVFTEIRESDKRAYMELNTDVVNNRYWGYDFREDLSIAQSVNEDTFYDSVMYDMRAGDSINLAIRRSEDGEMIGEAVLWNFTSDGFAEIGCRIFPEYQGRGYGKTAFGTVADFAARSLNVKILARCFLENSASYRMITASGFAMMKKDENYYYFERK